MARATVERIILNTSDAQEALGGIGRDLLWKLIKLGPEQGGIASIRVGGRRMIPRDAIDSFVDARIAEANASGAA